MGPANLLTALRIVLIPVFVGLLLYERHLAATAVFFLAAVTDALDGMAARRLDGTTRLGSFLDPLADKLLSAASFLTLSLKGPIPAWLVVLVISRDLMISLGALLLFLSDASPEVSPSALGKGATFCQFTTILLTLLLLVSGRGLLLWKVSIAVTALLTLLSGLQYLLRGLGTQERREG